MREYKLNFAQIFINLIFFIIPNRNVMCIDSVFLLLSVEFIPIYH